MTPPEKGWKGKGEKRRLFYFTTMRIGGRGGKERRRGGGEKRGGIQASKPFVKHFRGKRKKKKGSDRGRGRKEKEGERCIFAAPNILTSGEGRGRRIDCESG